MNDSQQSIDNILHNIRNMINKNNHAINKDADNENSAEIIELKEDDIDQKDNSKTYNKASDKYRDYNRDANIIDLTEKKITDDISDKIQGFLQDIHKQNQQKQQARSLDLENLVNQLIIPYLADWLNKNLADMVEEILSREIKKIIK